MQHPPSPRVPQRGTAIVWMAMFMAVLLMFIALGTDMAKLMVTRTQLQNAADAAALAGAYALSSTGSGVVDSARANAQSTAASNHAFQDRPTPVLVPDEDVVVDVANGTVTVTTRRQAPGAPMIPHFLQVLGIRGLDASAVATARGQWICRYAPFAVQPPINETLVPGRNYMIKNSPPNGTQGNYWPIDFPDCPGSECNAKGGAARYQCWLENGYPCCDVVQKNVCLPAEEGNMSGPTTDGIRNLIESDKDPRVGIYYDLTPSDPPDPDAYQGDGRRLFVAPITDEVRRVGSMKCYNVTGIGVFFLTDYASGPGHDNTVYAEYLGTPDEVGTSAKRFTVVLIR